MDEVYHRYYFRGQNFLYAGTFVFHENPYQHATLRKKELVPSSVSKV